MVYYSGTLIKNTPYCLYITGAAPMHRHEYWEIAIFLKGISYNHTPGGKIKCPPGTCIILRPNKDCHSITHEPGCIKAHLDLYISDKKMKSICSQLKSGEEISMYEMLMRGDKSPAFLLSKNAIAYIQELLSKQDFITRSPEMDNTHSSIITIILNEYHISLSNVNEPSEMIKQVIDLLTDPNNYCARLDELLKQVNYSRTYINREFKKFTGKTPIAFFDFHKILYSSELLLHTDKTILDISNTIGFSSTKNFIAQFKRVFSCTPSSYKKAVISPAEKG